MVRVWWKDYRSDQTFSRQQGPSRTPHPSAIEGKRETVLWFDFLRCLARRLHNGSEGKGPHPPVLTALVTAIRPAILIRYSRGSCVWLSSFQDDISFLALCWRALYRRRGM